MNRLVLASVAAVYSLLFSPLTPAFASGSDNCLDFDGSNDYAEGNGLSTSLDNITLDNANDTSLKNSSELIGTLTLTDGDLDLKGYTVTLGTSAMLSETEGNTIKGASGVITTTRTFNAGDLSRGENIVGIGAEITMSIVDSLSRWAAFEGEFTEMTNIPITGVYRSSVAWGDYDNDGDLDILLTGYHSKIYRNDGADTFTDIGASIQTVHSSGVAWGDYDNDGDLDILLTGNSSSGRITRLYRNEGSDTFTDIGAGLQGVSGSSVAWGDYDNDGDIDVLLTGYADPDGRVSRIYINEGSETFTDIGAVLQGVDNSSVAWGDYDNDGDLDILLTGYGGSGIVVSHIYNNEGGGTFTHTVSLLGVDWSSAAWGDYDNDGDLDVLLTGDSSGTSVSRIYRNDGSDTFTEMTGISLTGVRTSSVAWGDYDNDGDLDILLTGNTGSQYISRIYRNDGSDSFTEMTGIPLTGVRCSSVAWGDYDNDGDLDILLTGDTGSGSISRIYRNDAIIANAAPNAPASLSASVFGQEVTLSWDRSTDTETGQDALTYNLRIGASSAGGEIMPPMADASTGYRRIPALGNTNHDTTWTIQGLSQGWCYWSVQAIDNAFAGSPFAPVDSFYCLGADMILTGAVQLDTLVLEWSTVPPAAVYWVYGTFNEPHFAPELLLPYTYRVVVTADTTWSSPAGIADPDTNWTYQVIAVDGTDAELGRTNRFGEHEFELP